MKVTQNVVIETTHIAKVSIGLAGISPSPSPLKTTGRVRVSGDHQSGARP